MNNPTAVNGSTTRGWRIMVALLVAGFVLWTFGELRQATDPKWEDTEGYLAHSLYIAEHGGLAGYLEQSFAGEFPVVERHPLYMLMLAPFASRTAEFFWNAKLLNLATGIVALLTLVWMVSRRYGRGPAVVAGLLYAVSNSLVVASSHVNHEPHVALCVMWMWWFLTEPGRSAGAAGAHAGQMPPPVVMPDSVGRWALAGVWLGLAYMVKSSVILIAVAIVVAGLWRERLRFLTSPRVWVLLLAATLVSSPLLVRNTRAFGTPIYEGINSHITWLDDWSQLGDESTIAYYDRYGVHYLEKNGLPTLQDYLRTHDAGDIAARLAGGVKDQLTRVTRQALSPAFQPPSEQLTTWWGRGVKAWGFAVLAFAIAGWWLRRRSWEATLLFFCSGAFMAFFAWNVMFPVFRYWAPLVPIWISLAAYALWSLALRLLPAARAWRVSAGIVASVIVLLGAWTLASGALTRPQPILGSAPANFRMVEWMNRSIEPGDRVLLGPTREFYGLGWMVERPVYVLFSPNVDSLDGFLRFLDERKARYIVMNEDILQRMPGGWTDELARHVEVQADGTLVPTEPLPGWRVAYRDPGSPSRFIIYEAESLSRLN